MINLGTVIETIHSKFKVTSVIDIGSLSDGTRLFKYRASTLSHPRDIGFEIYSNEVIKIYNKNEYPEYYL